VTSVRDEGRQVFRELLPGLLPDGEEDLTRGGFGGELAELSFDSVFGRLWTREGLAIANDEPGLAAVEPRPYCSGDPTGRADQPPVGVMAFTQNRFG
jgi:hypothetical protein